MCASFLFSSFQFQFSISILFVSNSHLPGGDDKDLETEPRQSPTVLVALTWPWQADAVAVQHVDQLEELHGGVHAAPWAQNGAGEALEWDHGWGGQLS